jgi:hypothetical protein
MNEQVANKATRKRWIPVIFDVQEPQHQVLRHNDHCLDQETLETTSVRKAAIFLGNIERTAGMDGC